MANIQPAFFGGGRFWCLEAVFDEVMGVFGVTPGYMGGAVVNPSDQALAAGAADHVQVVCVLFDADLVRYWDLLQIFFVVHDPTQLDRQGPDIGPQYRSTIFWVDQAQRADAEKMISALSHLAVFAAPIVTEVTAAAAFYPAAPEHRQYYQRHAEEAYCAQVIAPKLERFGQVFAGLRRSLA